MNNAAGASEPILKKPSDDQQKVIDRIEAQRERLRVRRTERVHRIALLKKEQAVVSDTPLWVRTAVVARRYPVGAAVLAGVALLVGPKRLVRWAGVGLPLYLRMRGR